MSRNCHSLGLFPLVGGETALESRNFWSCTPPSLHSLTRFTSSSPEGTSESRTASSESLDESDDSEEVLSSSSVGGLLSGGVGLLGPGTGAPSTIFLQSFILRMPFSISIGVLSP